MGRTTKIIIGIFIALAAVSGALAFAVYSLQDKIDSRLQKGWVLPPLELYSQGIIFGLGRKFPQSALDLEFKSRELNAGRDYETGDRASCSRMSGLTLKETSLRCLWLRREQTLVAWDEKGFIQEIWRGDPWVQVAQTTIWPRLITQFFNQQPILQKNTPLAEMPLYCLQAATAIEDKDFLEHKGISITGTLRAVMRNLKAGRFAEGGSTITQQLVKNFFLTPKKTIKRKLSEQLLSIMLESQITKDQILEMYLNVIYMGQSGPYQVLGFGSAADYYFGKPIGQLNLPECALLGAIINNPGKFSPFNKTDAGRNRRAQVLDKMVEAGMIASDQALEAKNSPLPQAETKQRQTQAPYFVMTALKEFNALDLASAEEGARLYTTLDPELQGLMAGSVGKLMPAVEAKVKKPSKQPLQVSAITIDLASAQVVALTGGRDFRSTQFNRAFDSKRQVGSIVKPFVYLSVLDEREPITAIVDEPFEWKSGKNGWKPRNYDKKNYGAVPYFFALAQSLNVPAAKSGKKSGWKKSPRSSGTREFARRYRSCRHSRSARLKRTCGTWLRVTPLSGASAGAIAFTLCCAWKI
jgi:penicillin-binding protein 1B